MATKTVKLAMHDGRLTITHIPDGVTVQVTDHDGEKYALDELVQDENQSLVHITTHWSDGLTDVMTPIQPWEEY